MVFPCVCVSCAAAAAEALKHLTYASCPCDAAHTDWRGWCTVHDVRAIVALCPNVERIHEMLLPDDWVPHEKP